MKIKSLILTAILTIALLCSGGIVQAVDNSALIAQLQAQIASLMAQIKALTSNQPVPLPTPVWCYTFSTDFGVGAPVSSADLSGLVAALDKQDIFNPIVNPTLFNEDVAGAVVLLQQKYGIRASGWVGPLTRAKLNKLYGCGVTSIPQPACSNLYWFDNTNTTCQAQKQFCGAFMYYGLQTFTTQPACISAATTSAQPSMTITSPNGGEYYSNDGSLMNVNWTTKNVPSGFVFDVIRLRGYPNGGEIILVQNVRNDGSESISLKGVPAGTYILEMKAYLNGVLVMDGSDSYFKVVDPTANQAAIKVLSPNGGETLYFGKTYVAAYYTSSTNSSVSIFLDKYDVASSKPEGGSAIRIGDTGPGVQSYSFSIGDQIATWPGYGTTYKLRVCLRDTTTCDSSDNYFTIAPASMPQPTISYLSGSTAIPGSSVTIYGSNLYGVSNVVLYLISNRNVSISATAFVFNQDGTDATFNVPKSAVPGNYALTVFAPGSQVSSNEIPITIAPSSMPQPIITVTSPNGAEQWQTGTNHNITWNVQSTYNFNSTILLASALDASREWTLTPSVPSIANTSNTFAWTVGSATPFVNTVGSPPSGNYYIMVCRAAVTNVINGGENCDYSDNYFTITQ